MPSHIRPLAILLACILVASLAPAPAGAAQSIQTPTSELSDGAAYWQGTTIVESGYAPNASEASIYTASDQHVKNVTLQNGDLSISTDSMQGEYYVNAPGAPKVRFNVKVQTLGAVTSNGSLYLESNRGNYTALVEVSNSNGTTVTEHVFPDAPVTDGTARFEGASTVTVRPMNTSGLASGEYSIHISVAVEGQNSSTEASFSVAESSSSLDRTTSTQTTTDADTTTVSATPESTNTTSTSTAESGSSGVGAPGFTAPVAVLALLVAGLGVLGRRR